MFGWNLSFSRIPILSGSPSVHNDQMALGVLRAFAEAGVRVPEAISVVGFDDQPEAAHFLRLQSNRTSQNSGPGARNSCSIQWSVRTTGPIYCYSPADRTVLNSPPAD